MRASKQPVQSSLAHKLFQICYAEHFASADRNSDPMPEPKYMLKGGIPAWSVQDIQRHDYCLGKGADSTVSVIELDNGANSIPGAEFCIKGVAFKQTNAMTAFLDHYYGTEASPVAPADLRVQQERLNFLAQQGITLDLLHSQGRKMLEEAALMRSLSSSPHILYCHGVVVSNAVAGTDAGPFSEGTDGLLVLGLLTDVCDMSLADLLSGISKLRLNSLEKSHWRIAAGDLCRQLALAVKTMHFNGILNLDLKPQNALLVIEKEQRLTLKVNDFDNAVRFSPVVPIEPVFLSAPRGTPLYVDNTSISIWHVADKLLAPFFPASDVFSFGTIAVQLIQGLASAPVDTALLMAMCTSEKNCWDVYLEQTNACPTRQYDHVKCMLQPLLTSKDIDSKLLAFLAVSCLNTRLVDRPTAAEVVDFLSGLGFEERCAALFDAAVAEGASLQPQEVEKEEDGDEDDDSDSNSTDTSASAGFNTAGISGYNAGASPRLTSSPAACILSDSHLQLEDTAAITTASGDSTTPTALQAVDVGSSNEVGTSTADITALPRPRLAPYTAARSSTVAEVVGQSMGTSVSGTGAPTHSVESTSGTHALDNATAHVPAAAAASADDAEEEGGGEEEVAGGDDDVYTYTADLAALLYVGQALCPVLQPASAPLALSSGSDDGSSRVAGGSDTCTPTGGSAISSSRSSNSLSDGASPRGEALSASMEASGSGSVYPMQDSAPSMTLLHTPHVSPVSTTTTSGAAAAASLPSSLTVLDTYERMCALQLPALDSQDRNSSSSSSSSPSTRASRGTMQAAPADCCVHVSSAGPCSPTTARSTGHVSSSSSSAAAWLGWAVRAGATAALLPAVALSTAMLLPVQAVLMSTCAVRHQMS